MESAVRHQYDDLTKLQAFGSAAVTADAPSGFSVDLYRLTAGRGDLKNRYGLGKFDVVLHITSATFADADETYTIDVQSVDAAGANPVTHETIAVSADMVGKTIEVTIHPDSLAKMDADAAKLRLFANVGGTTPSLTYWAFASQLTR